MFTSNFERLDCDNYAFYISNDICKVYKRKTNKNSSRFPAIKTKYFTIHIMVVSKTVTPNKKTNVKKKKKNVACDLNIRFRYATPLNLGPTCRLCMETPIYRLVTPVMSTRRAHEQTVCINNEATEARTAISCGRTCIQRHLSGATISHIGRGL